MRIFDEDFLNDDSQYDASAKRTVEAMFGDISDNALKLKHPASEMLSHAHEVSSREALHNTSISNSTKEVLQHEKHATISEGISSEYIEVENAIFHHVVRSTSIEGFENEERVIHLHTQLQQKLASDAPKREVIKTCIQLNMEKDAIQQKRADFDLGIKETRHVGNIIGSIASIVGDAKTAQQIKMATASSLQVVSAVGGIMGFGKLASASPLEIADVLLSGIDGLFGLTRQEKKAPNILTVLLPLLEAISEQISTIRLEMHERFDEVMDELSAIQRSLIVNFAELSRDNKLTQKLVLQLMDAIERQHVQQATGFSIVTSRLDKLTSHLYHQEQNAIWGFFEKELKPIAKTHDPALYKNHLQRLLTGLEHSGAYAEAITGRPYRRIQWRDLASPSASFYMNTFASVVDECLGATLIYCSMQRMRAICAALQETLSEGGDIWLFDPIDESRIIPHEKDDSPLLSFKNLLKNTSHKKGIVPISSQGEFGWVYWDKEEGVIHLCHIPSVLEEQIISIIQVAHSKAYVATRLTLPEALATGDKAVCLIYMMRLYVNNNIQMALATDFSETGVIEQLQQEILALTPDFKEKLQVGNPLAIAYSILLLDYFYALHYNSKNPNTSVAISYDEIHQCLQLNERHIQPLRYLVTALQHPSVFETLIKNYQMSMGHFKIALAEYIETQKIDYAHKEKITARASFSLSQLQQPGDKEKFNLQTIPIGLDCFPWWSYYQLSHTGFKSNGDNYDRSHEPPVYNEPSLIARAKAEYTKKATEELNLSLRSYDGSLFIHPKELTGYSILLPMPTGIIDAIPDEVHYLSAKAGGLIRFYYDYDETSKRLILEGKISLPDGTDGTFFHKTIQHQLPYQGIEAIWWLWMGGKMPIDTTMQMLDVTSWQSDRYARFNRQYHVPRHAEIKGAFYMATFKDPVNLVPLSLDVMVVYEQMLKQNLIDSESYHGNLRVAVEDDGTRLGMAYEEMNRNYWLLRRGLECLEKLSPQMWMSRPSCALAKIHSAEAILQNARLQKVNAENLFAEREDIQLLHEAILSYLEARSPETHLFFEPVLRSFNEFISQIIPHATLSMSTPERAAIDDKALALLETVMHQVHRGEVQISSTDLAQAVLQGLAMLDTAKSKGNAHELLGNLSQAFRLPGSQGATISRVTQSGATLFSGNLSANQTVTSSSRVDGNNSHSHVDADDVSLLEHVI